MTEEQLKEILENHKHWLNKDVPGWETMKANLTYEDLRKADLHGVDLRHATLRSTNLTGANLSGANLHNAYLYEAILNRADLNEADLSNADLQDADLRNANLRNANLLKASMCYVDLRYANLFYTNLYEACLIGADFSGALLVNADLTKADLCNTNFSVAGLSGADFYEADLRGASLFGADLKTAKNLPYIPMVCPEEGEFIGWKTAQRKIIKLKIPADALRSSATTRKCRCNKAEVLEIYELDGTVSETRKVLSNYDKDFAYNVGKVVEVENFNTNRWNECAPGIHFFINRQEAIGYHD